MVLCFGDSITEGRPGVSYLRYVKNKKCYKNFGLGGDTLIGTSNRLRKILKNPKYENDRTIVIGIGANDLLLPFLKDYSKSWSKAVSRIIKRGSIPCKDERQFEVEYEELLLMLKSNAKNIIVFGIPYIETTASDLNYKAEIYNKVIENLCNQAQVSYIDIRTWQKDIKQKEKNTGSYFFTKDHLDVAFDSLLTTYLPFTDYVSKKRNLAVTIDGVHLNTMSAKGLAYLIENKLLIYESNW